ncbi:MAG: DUF2807 domain-containing protein [Cystobacter sp.]
MRRHIRSTRAFALAGLCGLLLVGCAGAGEGGGNNRAVGSGLIVEDQPELTGFSGVHVGFGVYATITVGPTELVKIRGDDNLLALIHWKVKDGVLTADRDAAWESFQPTEPLRLTVVTPRLTRLKVTGGSHANASGVESPGFSLDASAGSEVTISGRAGQLVLEASGGSWVDLRDFPVEGLDIEASGGSHVRANVSGQLTGQLSGGSELTCDGQPYSRLVSTSGGSGVTYP